MSYSFKNEVDFRLLISETVIPVMLNGTVQYEILDCRSTSRRKHHATGAVCSLTLSPRLNANKKIEEINSTRTSSTVIKKQAGNTNNIKF